MRSKVTITLETSVTPGDLFSALGLLEPGSKFTVTSEPLPNGKGKRGKYKPKVLSSGDLQDPPSNKYHDPRIVWDDKANRINVDASLKNIGLTRADLMDRVTKAGTVEHIIKCSMKGRGY